MKQKYVKILIGILAMTTAIISSNRLITEAANSKNPSSLLSDASTGQGKTESPILSQNVFNVILPATPDKPIDKDTPLSDFYNFILDPDNLLPPKYPDKTFEPNTSLYFPNNDHPLYDYAHTSNALTIQNKSTMGVDIKLQASLAGMNNITLTNDKTFSNSKTPSVYLALTDSSNKTSVIDKYGAFLKTTLPGQKEAYETVYDRLTDKYKYALKDDTVLSANNISFADYTFQLEGNCNSAGDWSDLDTSVSPKITVTWSVAPRPGNVAPSIGKTIYSMTKNTANTIYIDLGSGDLAATDISSIIYKTSSNVETILGTDNYTFIDDTLIFNASHITNLVDMGIKSRTYIITFNDKAETQVNVTLNILDTAPSIEQKSYIMTNGQPILVDVDLGTGVLEATGIKTITFRNKAGILTALPVNNYDFANGKLIFTAEHISNIISAGITSRDYTIILNDKAETDITINFSLSNDSINPSIDDISHAIYKNQPLSIDVNLGSGDLKANGIKSISFINKTGVSNTLATSSYLFADETLTFTAEHINNVINAGIISRDYIITFDNVTSTQVTITVTADNALPSIPTTSYTMISGQPVVVDINLGSGNLGASGISSITFNNKAGALTTLAANGYSLTGEKLIFTATHITNVLNGGITSRDYNIIFNDNAKTCVTITLTANGDVPSITSGSTYAMNRGQSISLNVDLGSGDLKATDIKSITFKNKAGVSTTLPTSAYTFTNGILTLDATHINNVLNAAITTRDYTIVFDNIASTQAIVTLTAEERAPSIPVATYTMKNGQSVIVSNIDLGSGSLAASGISSVTFNNKAGVPTTLTTDAYSFTGETLTFTATHISKVIANGIISRNYTITFNDKNATCIPIELTASGNAPSVTTGYSYVMHRNQPISLNVDLGSGDLKATGIKSVTFNDKNGNPTLLPASSYTFSNGSLSFAVSHINNVLNAAITARDYTITFNNVASTKTTVTLTAENIAPSVKATSYTMISGQPVLVDIDLGSGNLAASGISSITFVSKTGVITTLAVSGYTFTSNNGRLTFAPAHISNVIKAGITHRSYTITLNNAVATRITVNLTQ